MHTLVSEDGRVFDVSDNDLVQFAVDHRLIDGSRQSTNVRNLVDPSHKKQHVKLWQPLGKLRWLGRVDLSTGQRRIGSRGSLNGHRGPIARTIANG